MKNIVPKECFRTVLLLFMSVLLTFPSTGTGSKYVWEDTIDITLKVSYPEQVITSVRPVGYLSESWIRDLKNIRATPTADGLILTADEGYTLPEYIAVGIGQTTYSVKTDGTEAPEGMAFNPETGMLSVSDIWMTESQASITVTASAEKTVA